MTKKGTELHAPIENAFVCNYVSGIWVEVFPHEWGAAREAVVEAARVYIRAMDISEADEGAAFDALEQAVAALEELERE
jgi:hypothetical protein